MPRNANSEQAPKVMTWGKAAPILIVAGVFDAARIFFTMFWFFGPALVAAYCTAKVGSTAVVGKLLTASCVAVAGSAGFVGAPALEAFGAVMAMAVGFGGWLAVGGLLMLTNSRIFKENAAWFVTSLAVSEIPLVGALPALSGIVWKMYSHQIKLEKSALQTYEKKHAVSDLRTRQEQVTMLVRARQQEVENNAQYTQEEREVA